VIKVKTKLAIGIGTVVAVFVIVFCALPLKEVSYEGIEKYMAPQTSYTEEPYTERVPYPAQAWQPAQLQARLVADHMVWFLHLGAKVYRPETGYHQVTRYQDTPVQTYVWKERTVTLYKKVPFIEALIGGY
jgi:hypothetical protein